MININNRIATLAVNYMGTMYCVYLFFMLVMIPIAFPSTMPVIMYISSSIIQLISLPLIMVGQNILGQSTEKRAQEDHDNIMSELAEIKAMHLELTALL